MRNTWPLNDGYGRFWHTDLSPKSDPKRTLSNIDE
jgi:hypothetical protein